MHEERASRTPSRPRSEVGRLLDDLAHRVPEVRHAVVLGGDGLVAGASGCLLREDADHLAAVASAFHSLARGTGRHFASGAARQTMVELEDGYLFIAGAGDGSCLAVLSSSDADIGLLAYEVARLVRRVGELRGTEPRFAP
ncbi:dynein regulation protein LC7 [Streptomyces sp. Ru73]|uniref:roadblock/LC7 domain-containing protein n=1 Tax=Streptomyces sp. Ru73 TaxID=2080748 RepID=UPI000CDE3446|nr:roadblock/LC7 domain-containing protein [Streptomyces sp. Ru73]POX38779.1 dynein regulation protein LC7 [Streptomyces sp. Ru73]